MTSKQAIEKVFRPGNSFRNKVISSLEHSQKHFPESHFPKSPTRGQIKGKYMARDTNGFVFAVNKPSGISSAQVIRDLSDHFNPSKLFKPWKEAERERLSKDPNSRYNKHKRWKRQEETKLKIGHGGTLDPGASGVLVVGIGSGTKELSKFLECTKSYEAVVLFGAATDSYDDYGKVIGRRPFEHITRDKFEKVLERFRGNIKQKPPIFSALKMDGKKLYEYAREGKEPPRKIEERDVEVKELELLEWMEPGQHEYVWPKEEAESGPKEYAMKTMKKEGDLSVDVDTKEDQAGTRVQSGAKRKLGEAISAEDEGVEPEAKRPKDDGVDIPVEDHDSNEPAAPEESKTTEAPTEASHQLAEPPRLPAARVRMTTSGGFYVRSLCHDLGLALDSFGIMSNLIRLRQGDYKLSDEFVLRHDELAKGEDVWAPKVQKQMKAFHNRGKLGIL